MERQNRPEGADLEIALHFEIMYSCVMILFSHVERHGCLGGACCLYLQGWRSELSWKRQYTIWEGDGYKKQSAKYSKIKIHVDKCGQLFNCHGLGPSATQALCKCLMSKNACITSEWSVHIHITPYLSHKNFAKHGFDQHTIIIASNPSTGWGITLQLTGE